MKIYYFKQMTTSLSEILKTLNNYGAKCSEPPHDICVFEA